ncbi:hypothetical protein ABI59_08185 [Acidobacteria bacterium Mor1]|nr:hypothetical protein ABI59_08185 [Acidobacteria bacterium Mor1]
MISAPKITSLLLAVALLAMPAVAQDPEPTEPPEKTASEGTDAPATEEGESAPEGTGASPDAAAPSPTQSQVIPSGGRFTRLEAERIRGQPDKDLLLEGKVTIGWGEVLLQADRIEVKEGRYLDAEGHILMVWQENRISGSRVTYDLDEDFGLIENAIGQVQGGYYFWADSAEKTGSDKLHLDSATVTTCTQPVPYWSFSVSSANIRLNKYAHMYNARLKSGKVPFVYLPYVIWPVKRDRAAGLLLPDFGRTASRGRVINQPLFIPIGRSADLTLLGRYYTVSGFGGGGTLRFVPNDKGNAIIDGFFIRDKVASPPFCPADEAPCSRYRASYKQTQSFSNGFRMVADINLVSDFNFFSDFEYDLNLVSSPTILARLEFSRNGKWTSLNVRELRREQLFSGGTELTQSTLPEIEWRGRSRRLGDSPFYLSFESSLASIRQDGTESTQPNNADYFRADLFPTITAPWSPKPWLDITPSVRYRVTHWTQQQENITVTDPVTNLTSSQLRVVDESLTRDLFGANLEIVGPKFFRVFERPDSKYSKKYKHSIEPNLSYGFFDEFDRIDDILRFDEVDRVAGSGATLSYGIRSRLFAKRPRGRNQKAPLASAIQLPPGLTPDPGAEERAAQATAEDEGVAVEIASLELRQSRSFETDLSSANPDGLLDTGDEDTSPFSPWTITGRFNPTQNVSLDLRSSFDVLQNKISDVTVSGSLKNQWAFTRFSLINRQPLSALQTEDTQLRLTAATRLFQDRLELAVDGSIDFDPEEDRRRIPNSQIRMTYRTQCCTIMVQRFNRDFESLENRDDWQVQIDLQGIGKLLNFSN